MSVFRPALICLSLLYSGMTFANESGFRWVDSAPGQTDLMYGPSPVLRYMHAYDDSSSDAVHDTYKVFHHVFGPQSGKIITKGAGGKYTHHRGLYVGWNKTQTPDGEFDFWHCKNGAHLRHVKFLSKDGDQNSGRMVAEIHWNNASGEPVIRELRSVTVKVIEISGARAWQIDWSTRLESRRGDIQLRGDRQHAGFQFRAAQAVADANSARFIRPQGFPEQAEAFQVGDKGDPPAHINLHWFAMIYPLEQSSYTVEYLESPGQPQPSLYSERPYGRFGAFYKADLTTEQPLEMTYRVIVSEGAASTREQIQQRYDDFASSPKAK